jgi:hypothetical protein
MLFEPQQRTVVFCMRTQLCMPPALISATPLASPVTSTGTALGELDPLPSCPLMFQPQHLAPPAVVRAQE